MAEPAAAKEAKRGGAVVGWTQSMDLAYGIEYQSDPNQLARLRINRPELIQYLGDAEPQATHIGSWTHVIFGGMTSPLCTASTRKTSDPMTQPG
jgi:hypothetical protein